ncbi:MAG: SAF domain-containing protein [Desulfocucumaceae bacterium]
MILSAAAGASVLYALYMLYLPVKVLAPKNDIPAGVVIGQDDIGYITVSRRDKHILAITDQKQVIGKYTKDKLYAREPILSKKVVIEQKDISDIKSGINQDETYLTFKQNEARWPFGIKNGDIVTVVAIFDGGNPQVVGKSLKVLEIASPKNVAGTIDQIKSAVANSPENSITLAIKWNMVGALLMGKTQSKEMWILPEQEGLGPGIGIYESDQLDYLRQLASGKGNVRLQKPR